MDILIKNMEMQNSCDDCFACFECPTESFDYCNILKTMTTRGERRKDCPLVALPEHGRLGDLDALLRRVEAIDCFGDPDKTIDRIIQAIENAPTIVEANE